MQEPFKHRTSKNQPRKPLKTVYFLTKPDDNFGKHGKRIYIQDCFFNPCTFRHISRGRIHARIRRFSTFVFTSSPSLRKPLCINGLSVKDSPHFTFTLAFTEGFGSLYTMHISCETKWLRDHCVWGGRRRDGKIGEEENKVNKGWRKRRGEAFTPNAL